MTEILDYLFGAASFVPHGYCLLWRPDLVALHAISDLLIAIAYFSIPVGLWYVVRSRPDIAYKRLFVLFAAFILLCGMSHVAGLITLWAPIYGLQGMIKAATAAVSLVAAYSLWPAIPRALAIPALDQFRQTNLEMGRAISERETLASGLSAANRDLEDFANSVAHDLRSPLRSINGFSQILMEEYGSQIDERGKEMLNRVNQATVNMSHLIDDLLYLSHLRQMPLQRADVDLSALAMSIVKELRQSDPKRDVLVRITDGLEARCDPELIRIALRQLLQNAWKFTSKKAHARIEFGTRADGDQTVFHVTDNGIGFNMDYSEKLFQPFQRLHTADEFDGSGIGLAIVTRIIHRHGGKIDAEAKLGEGTSFTFTL